MLPCRVCGVPTLNKTPKPKRCADCTKAEALDYSRWYYSVHRDEMREYHRIYHINNRGRILDRIPLWHLPEIFMTLQEAKSIARHLGLTLRQVRSGDYRVNFRDGNETTAYYTDKLEDAVSAVVEMARNRGQSPC